MLVVAALGAGCALNAAERTATVSATVPAVEATPASPLLGATEVAALRERIRGHAKTHCGNCHLSSRPTAPPAALAIYDLDRDDWHEALTVPRLQNGFPRRLNSRLDEVGQRDLREFIAYEVALRKR